MINVKIGLYLQDYRKNIKNEFYNVLANAKNAKLDLLVFPEVCYTPFDSDFYENDILNNIDNDKVRERAIEISEYAGSAVIVGGRDKYGIIYSVYANAYCDDDETETALYFKHTAAWDSPLGFAGYGENVELYFQLVLLKRKKIGMTICYDCNHAAFSRMYYKACADIIINTTGGNVVKSKWHRYNKVRAIENNCFNFCTMGYHDNSKENSFNFGFTPHGKLMTGIPMAKGGTIGNITVYDTNNAPTGFEDDINLNQTETINAKGNYMLDVSKFNDVLMPANEVAQNIWSVSAEKENLIICTVDSEDILKPEKVLSLLYNIKLNDITNKRYLIVNRWNKLDRSFYNAILSDVLKVRSMENYCAVMLIADGFIKCYQCGMNRTAQTVAAELGAYNLDLGRMSGPEAIWKNKPGMMRAVWRNGYEKIIEHLRCNSQ